MNRASRRRLLWVLALLLLVIAATLMLLLPKPGQGIAAGPAPLRYVGAASCEECHAEEAQRAKGSHHDLAMQEAVQQTVLGDFSDARLGSARFYGKGDALFVRTEGADGRFADFRVARTLGAYPLQQYLIGTTRGRFQALGMAWDARPAAEGGQRWTFVGDGPVHHRDARHWTQRARNWNSQCAECHSTNVRKGYDLAEDRFSTAFSDPNVSCEACHGPGSRHADWAKKARAGGRKPTGDPGFVVRFEARRVRAQQTEALGVMASGTRPAALLSGAPGAVGEADERAIPAVTEQEALSRAEVETCARCHAKRTLLDEDYWPGRLLLETHRPALLDEGLYFADGQARGEVHEWGSFVQSRMYAAGVRCSDCHDAHDQKLAAGRGAALAAPDQARDASLRNEDRTCIACHAQERFATRSHHFHREGGRGSACISCHMRSEPGQGLHGRNDHSFRVPRPDLTVALGSEQAPNACNDCHRDRSARWAAAAYRRRYPQGRAGTPHFAEALHAGRTWKPGAERALLALVRDTAQPGIARATAVSLLAAYATPASFPVIQKAAADPDALVRLGAAATLDALPVGERVRAGISLLWDPVRAVRVEAVLAFAELPDTEFASEQRAAFDRALDEYLLAQRANAERPEAHVNLGRLNARRGRVAEARRSYETALRLEPAFVPAQLALAELLLRRQQEKDAEALVRKALRIEPGNASAHQALARLLEKRKRPNEALASSRRAYELAPAAPGIAVDHASRLQASGRVEEALGVLEAAQRLRPGARELLVSLVRLNLERRAERRAREWARRLALAAPDDPEARTIARSLGLELDSETR